MPLPRFLILIASVLAAAALTVAIAASVVPATPGAAAALGLVPLAAAAWLLWRGRRS